MGINKCSLYNTFGSKKNLFIHALRQYDRDRSQVAFVKINANQDPMAAIIGMFDHAIEHNYDTPDKKGFLLVNTALELPHHDMDIRDIVTASLDNLSYFFKYNIMRGQSDWVFTNNIEPKPAAQVLRSLIVGLQVL
ncbi:MAG: TetR/AcrR family transcriptional regulator [Amylibacter sp.]